MDPTTMTRAKFTEDETETSNHAVPVNDNSKSGTVITTPSDHKCHLLALPAELRNWIYEVVVSQETPLTIDFRTGCFCKGPVLPRTCRQIREETLPLYYQVNEIRLYNPWSHYVADAKSVFLGIAAACLEENAIQKLDIMPCCHDNFFRLDLSKGLRDYNLEVVKRVPGCDVGQKTLAKGKMLLDSFVAMADAADRPPIMTEADLRQLIFEVQMP